MNMHWIDWLIVGAMLGGSVLVALLTSTLMRSVSDFLVANRCAGRYLLTMASGMSGLGAINIAANFEKYYQAGFGAQWWAQAIAPIMLILALSGFVVFRYRETRAMTMAQFFEMRYSRRFRIFCGVLAWLSGMLNYGIFPAVTSRFLIHFTGLPTEVSLGGWEVPTVAPVMAGMLSLALFMAMSGGQIAVMVTDFLQGQFFAITVVLILGVLLYQMSWSELIAGLSTAPEGQSRINPFDQAAIPDFNMWFFLMFAALQIYGYQAWQGSSAYNGSAKTAHEAKMAKVLAEFRGIVVTLLMLSIPIFMYAVLNGSHFPAQASAAQGAIDQIHDPQIQKQMRVPIILSQMLPVGLMGMFAAAVVAAALSTDNTYLHSWGSMFIQDVIVPLRGGKHLKPRTHMWLLRLSMVGVAAFAFVFSLLFPLKEYIFMYFQLTGAIYLGGAGAAILGGLYWSRGTTAGAWTGMIVGSAMAFTGVALRNILWPYAMPSIKERFAQFDWIQSLPDTFPFHGTEVAFAAASCAMASYVIVSLCSHHPRANMQKLLHRGPYAVEPKGETPSLNPNEPHIHGRSLWRFLGVTPQFTRGDKAIYLLKLTWTGFFFLVFLVGTTVNLIWDVSNESWAAWWHFQFMLTLGTGICFVIWFLLGGLRDLVDMISTLRTATRDATDDGVVSESEHVQP